MVFATQSGRNLEVCMDDIMVKTTSEKHHIVDLMETFASIRSHNMRLNSDKCIFTVQARKFLGFMLINRGIKANPDKYYKIIDM